MCLTQTSPLHNYYKQRRYGPGIVIHFEDVGATSAFELLRLLRGTAAAFNDDVQGTAAVTAAAVLGAARLPGVPSLKDQTFLFYGAGQVRVFLVWLDSYEAG